MESSGTRRQAGQRSAFVIEAVDITKRYGHVQALAGASLQVRPGEVLALVGDNGAGKSTLTKVICGALAPDGGTLSFWGEATRVTSTRHAQDLGVETVYQDLALAPDLSVAENMFLGREPIRRGVFGGWPAALDRRRMREAARDAIKTAGITTLSSVDRSVRDLSGGQRQAIAVARAVMWATSAILMDEPTAALGTKQTDIVYDSIRSAAARGLAILVISHDIPKMLGLADRVAVMRQGRTIANLPARDLTISDVVTLMLGGTARGEAA
ncbi:ATP-binding cassette domain-containing protein [Labrys wisconsinensis]|uniref:ATP-binding cassette domain-containing protein n=1 Tax=Labrys wisconsinensis TaxID=425677 RepID=UPI0027D7E58D|nr:ATP-binding cassette domain-containing protein [Labrys wisconsinensis]